MVRTMSLSPDRKGPVTERFRDLNRLPVNIWHEIMVANAISAGVIAITVSATVKDHISLINTNSTDFRDYQDKLQLVGKFQVLPATWLIVVVTLIVIKRMSSGAWNPMNGFEYNVRSLKNVLANSIEQAVISLVTQLTLIAYFDSQLTARWIPLINTIYLISRVIYYIGYPQHRWLGFALWSQSLLIAHMYAVWSFVNDDGLS